MDQAVKDNDTIYGVITGTAGTGSATVPGEINYDPLLAETLYEKSLGKALKDADTGLNEISLYERGSLGSKIDDEIENQVLKKMGLKDPVQTGCDIRSTSSVIGNTQAASSLFSVIRAALCLHYRQMTVDKTVLKACVASITLDGACSHLVVEKNRTIDKKRSQSINFDPDLIAKTSLATSKAHEKFLEFSQNSYHLIEKQFKTLAKLAGNVVHGSDSRSYEQNKLPAAPPAASVLLDREQCLEFAVGKAGNVLGKEFDIIDTYPVRVRLPDEPLMLVDRIMDIQGEMLSLTSGRIITQHDVKENAWYLDGEKAPVSISIEAGQADLFLCAWLGIDHVVKGSRKYRLLDAKVTFHRTLPEPGETIEYHIEIDRFLKQADVYLFFFHYKGFINNRLLISMTDGCAGFFTEQEVEDSKGIILKTEDLKEQPPAERFTHLIPVQKESFSDEKIHALRHGDLGTAFGENFNHITLGKNLKLPGKKMHLIDRVLEFDPEGGRFHQGSIIAEADIHPDDWFLQCHFIDDMVMPGTLMYECCAHALRIFTQRMGWVSQRDDLFYDVVLNNESDLKCRGPVTPDTKKARYEIEIKKMAYDPEPFVTADAHMFSDDLQIVLYKDMGMKIKGLTEKELNSFWKSGIK